MLTFICEQVKSVINIMMGKIENDSDEIESIVSDAASAPDDELLSKIPTTVGPGSSTIS